MIRDLPSSSEILEEQIQKVIDLLNGLKLSSFDAAMIELTNLHRFMLLSYSGVDEVGELFNYAELTDGGLARAHEEWIGEYRRLFERSVEAISKDPSFAKMVVHIPGMLLSGFEPTQFSGAVTKGILDLAPMFVHRLESWVTSRTLLQPDAEIGGSATKLFLVGTNAKVYEEVVLEFVGSWESLARMVSVQYQWHSDPDVLAHEQWIRFRRSWDYVWQHLTNTAYLIAVSAWNEDDIGATLYADSFLRWPNTLNYRAENARDYLFDSHFAFPDLLELSWEDACAAVSHLTPRGIGQLSPDDLFTAIVARAHEDVLFLTSLLLSSWVANDKQLTDVGIRVAANLLKKQTVEDDSNNQFPPVRPSFVQTGLQVVRLELASTKYASRLNESVRQMDQMTERRVVSGRVFTPTTLHGTSQLRLEQAAILASLAPAQGDAGLAQKLLQNWERVALGPDGDSFIRDVARELGLVLQILEIPSDAFDKLIIKVSEEVGGAPNLGNLKQIIQQILDDIEEFRADRLKSAPIDTDLLSRLEKNGQIKLLSLPEHTNFFVGFVVHSAAELLDSVPCEFRLTGISKGDLTNPRMSDGSLVEEEFPLRLARRCSARIWGKFTELDRTQVALTDEIYSSAFWDNIEALLDGVGPKPILVVPHSEGTTELLKTRYANEGTNPRLTFDESKSGLYNKSYRGTVSGVDIHSSAFPIGTAWLFSAEKLRQITFRRRPNHSSILEIAYEPSNEFEGALAARFEFQASWSTDRTYELTFPDKAR